MNKILFFSFLVTLILSSSACKSPVEKAPVTTPEARIEVEKISWQAEWDKILTQAKKDGKVAIYTSLNSEIRAGITEAFKQKYGINIEFTAGQPTDLQRKLTSEYSSGLYLADIIIGGDSAVIFYKDRNMLSRLASWLILPEVKDDKAWYRGEVPFFDKEGYIISSTSSATGRLAINTDMVRKDEIKFARDLLNPRWKGKMLVDDPYVPGPGQQNLIVLTFLHGEDWARELVKQEPVITRDARLLAEWVARGKYPVAIGPRVIVKEMMGEGLPIAYQMLKDGTYLSSSTSATGVFNKAPHPDAAKLFLNWFLSKEGQTLFTKLSGWHSSRIDVEASLADPSMRRDPELKGYNTISEEFIINIYPKYLPLIQKIFAPLRN